MQSTALAIVGMSVCLSHVGIVLKSDNLKLMGVIGFNHAILV